MRNPFATKIAGELLARGPRYPWGDGSGAHWDARSHWKPADTFQLGILADARVSLNAAADILGRPPSTVAWRARDTGLTMPHAWGAAIRPKRAAKPREARRPLLAYPFVVKRRDEHADLLAVNNIVPRGIPGRDDICQEIMLALWEGTITLDQLRSRASNVRAFVRGFKKSNFEAGGYARSLDAPVYGDSDLRLIDTLSTEDGLWANA